MNKAMRIILAFGLLAVPAFSIAEENHDHDKHEAKTHDEHSEKGHDEHDKDDKHHDHDADCLLYTSPSPRD